MVFSLQDQEVHLRDYLYILRKRRKVILLFLAIMLAGGGLFTFFEDIIYRAEATLLIEPENPNVMNFKEVVTMDASSSDYYQTQYQMLKSIGLADRLIEREKLLSDDYLQMLQRKNLFRKFKEARLLPAWLDSLAETKTPAEVFVNKMLIVEPVRNSRLVQVSVIHPDAKRSAQITNGLLDLFIQSTLESRLAVHLQATELISAQLIELKKKVAEAEEKLQAYKEEKNLVNIPSVREQSGFIQDAKMELVKSQADASRLAKRYLPDHPKMIRIRSEIEAIESNISEEEKKNMQQGRIAIEYAQLEREAESTLKIYEALLARLGETHSAAKSQASNIMVLDRAKPPARPYKPRPILNMIAALFAGAGGGIALAFFLEYFNSTVRIPEDIEKGLGLDLFGIIPQEASKPGGDSTLFFTPDAVTPISESFRALRTALLFRLRHLPGCRVILVTSPNPSEGKSTIALNLAAAFQQSHLKILLIDADLRKAQLHQRLKVTAERGLSEALEGELPVKEIIRENVNGLGFDFVTSGKLSRHPAELLGSAAMQKLIESLRSTYDIILIDSPPYLPVADVSVISEFADALIIVARYQKTDKRQMRALHRRFNEAGKKNLGVVINQVSVRERDYYFQQYYYYGYGDAGKKP